MNTFSDEVVKSLYRLLRHVAYRTDEDVEAEYKGQLLDYFSNVEYNFSSTNLKTEINSVVYNLIQAAKEEIKQELKLNFLTEPKKEDDIPF